MMSAGCANPCFDGSECTGEVEAGWFGFASLQLSREYADRFESGLFHLSNVPRRVFGRPLGGEAFQQSASVLIATLSRCFENGSAVVGFEQADLVGHTA